MSKNGKKFHSNKLNYQDGKLVAKWDQTNLSIKLKSIDLAYVDFSTQSERITGKYHEVYGLSFFEEGRLDELETLREFWLLELDPWLFVWLGFRLLAGAAASSLLSWPERDWTVRSLASLPEAASLLSFLEPIVEFSPTNEYFIKLYYNRCQS